MELECLSPTILQRRTRARLKCLQGLAGREVALQGLVAQAMGQTGTTVGVGVPVLAVNGATVLAQAGHLQDLVGVMVLVLVQVLALAPDTVMGLEEVEHTVVDMELEAVMGLEEVEDTVVDMELEVALVILVAEAVVLVEEGVVQVDMAVAGRPTPDRGTHMGDEFGLEIEACLCSCNIASLQAVWFSHLHNIM